MAASNNLITTQEAYDIICQLRAKSHGPALIEEPTAACFMIDLDLALTDQDGAHIDRLAQIFDDMVMFESFTHERVDEDGSVTVS